MRKQSVAGLLSLIEACEGGYVQVCLLSPLAALFLFCVMYI